MIKNPEIKNIIFQLFDKEAAGGFPGFAEKFYSSQADLLVIGSDPGEWLTDREAILRFYQSSADTGLKIKLMDLQAYSEGALGWSADREKLTFPNGNEYIVRHTFILHKENSEWKIVHSHASLAIENDMILAKK